MVFAYHGTDAEFVDEILDSGLKPRQSTGRSNWSENDMESIPNHVYLSRLYGIYFGIAAVDSPMEDPLAVYEIDVSKLSSEDLYPDEDFIEQAIRRGSFGIEPPTDYNHAASLAERTHIIREHIEEYQDEWMQSFTVFGNISHKGKIPSQAISRVSVIDAPSEFIMQIDPTITIENAMLVGDRYEFYTNLVFDEAVTIDDAFAALNIPQIEIPESFPADNADVMRQHVEGQRNAVEDLLQGEFWDVRENPNY